MNALETLTANDAIARLVDRDPTLFSSDVDMRQPIMQRLGWTDLAEKAEARLPQVQNLATAMHAEGVRDVVLLGMGGSSLAALVMAEVLGPVPGAPTLHVLDTTSPLTVSTLMERLDPSATAFVLASKSGTTVEPLSLYRVFREWADDALGRVAAGKRFVVVTDPGSDLEKRRQKDIMRIALLAPATVGGRFSALSLFGLAPAALCGLDVAALVSHALDAEKACHGPVDDNPGALLAAWMADAHSAGRDKLTFVASPRYASFGLWIEQLVAESTGKDGTGIVPVLEDGRVPVSAYGPDRMLVVMREPDDADREAFAGRARDAGVPTMEFVLGEPAGIGAEFVRWEFAVALLGHLMGVNPFDEPNVAEAKAATNDVLAGTVSAPAAQADLDGVWPTMAGSLSDAPIPDDLDAALEPLVRSLSPGDYLAVLAYLPYVGSPGTPLYDAAAAVSEATRVPVCVELGPRYLHSTGQLHKGGPRSGAFLMITTREHANIGIPGAPYTLAQLFRAQAEGDLVTLANHGLRVVRLDLPDHEAAISRVADALVRVARTGADPAPGT
jgi:glucose-6-phosphate isomerase